MLCHELGYISHTTQSPAVNDGCPKSHPRGNFCALHHAAKMGCVFDEPCFPAPCSLHLSWLRVKASVHFAKLHAFNNISSPEILYEVYEVFLVTISIRPNMQHHPPPSQS
uniref:Uncharacterized protein n=1 Tax=Eutreptiella gymnastica TaxID=73025 RepID=A0A7S1J5Y3_9EUGL